MTTEHRLIPDAQRHEPKGASGATIGQVPVSNGDGTTTFKFVDYNTVLNKPASRGYIQVLLGSSSAASQQPSATNTPLQIEYGAAQSLADASLAATGALTFNTSGQYIVVRTLRFNRTALAGTAMLFSRFLLNGSQSGPPINVAMDNNLDAVVVTSNFIVDATAGQVLTSEIIRDSSGVNIGGLFSATPATSGWSTAPSASIAVYKFRGAT